MRLYCESHDKLRSTARDRLGALHHSQTVEKLESPLNTGSSPRRDAQFEYINANPGVQATDQPVISVDTEEGITRNSRHGSDYRPQGQP